MSDLSSNSDHCDSSELLIDNMVGCFVLASLFTVKELELYLRLKFKFSLFNSQVTSSEWIGK